VTALFAGELFDFDLEVEPILEVLVGRVLEQGLMEVMEEEELAVMRAHQRQMQALRDAGKSRPLCSSASSDGQCSAVQCSGAPRSPTQRWQQ
jgi:hypothetical protein